jgi:hypothetical protein
MRYDIPECIGVAGIEVHGGIFEVWVIRIFNEQFLLALLHDPVAHPRGFDNLQYFEFETLGCTP